MSKSTLNDAAAVLEALGLTDAAEAVRGAGSVQVAARKARPVQVNILEGAAQKKYGDVQIAVKPQGSDRFIPKVTFRQGDLDFVIDELTAARDTLAS